MEKGWFDVDPYEADSSSGIYMGVFNRSPLEIGASLQRPRAPAPYIDLHSSNNLLNVAYEGSYQRAKWGNAGTLSNSSPPISVY